MLDKIFGVFRKPAKPITIIGLFVVAVFSVIYRIGNFGGGFIPVFANILLMIFEVVLFGIVSLLLIIKKDSYAKNAFIVLFAYWIISSLYGCLNDARYADKTMDGTLVVFGVFRFLTVLLIIVAVIFYIIAKAKNNHLFENLAFMMFGASYIFYIVSFILCVISSATGMDWNDYFSIIKTYLFLPVVMFFAVIFFFPPQHNDLPNSDGDKEMANESEQSSEEQENPQDNKKELSVHQKNTFGQGIFATSAVAVFLIAVFLIGGIADPGFFMLKNNNVKLTVQTANGFEKTEYKASEGTKTIGSINENGCVLKIKEGSFLADTTFTAEPLSEETIKSFNIKNKFETIVSPMDIKCENYDGSPLGEAVIFTVPIPEGVEDISECAICYYDEQHSKPVCFVPSSFDMNERTMSLELPHFSFWWGAKKSKQEFINEYLDEYSTQQAVRNLRLKNMASELEPYLTAKAEALKLKKEAAADLVQSTISYLCSEVSFEGEGKNEASAAYSLASGQLISAARCIYDNDIEKGKEFMKQACDAAMVEAWKYNKYSETIKDKLLGKDAEKWTADGIDKFIENAGNLGTFFGCIAEGDGEGAGQALGDVLKSIHPAADITTNAVKYVATTVNAEFTFWKAEKIDELYQVYKNGKDGLFGNTVFPEDKESFLMYLNTASGLTNSKGINRFFKMDKIEDICKRYGWSFKTYSELPQQYRDEFERRIEADLMNYFETRSLQENEAARIRKEEEAYIESLLDNSFSVLKESYYKEYFGEKNGEFNVKVRLARLLKERNEITAFVDLTKLARSTRDGGINWGDIMNHWVMVASKSKKSEALKDLVDYLKHFGVLKKGMDKELERLLFNVADVENREFFGVTIPFPSFGTIVEDETATDSWGDECTTIRIDKVSYKVYIEYCKILEALSGWTPDDEDRVANFPSDYNSVSKVYCAGSYQSLPRISVQYYSDSTCEATGKPHFCMFVFKTF